jgi:uncharacterized cupredoxin-like copper-binding protein
MKRTAVAAALVALFATACGGGHGDRASSAPARTVDINMEDITFQPATFSAQRGERVRFVFHNQGKVPHDAFIGDPAAQADHEREMRQGSAGGHSMHGDSDAITVDPGKTGSLTHTFDHTGTIEIGCHQPGHYAAGMKVAVTVA